jgi:hypothetical protein
MYTVVLSDTELHLLRELLDRQLRELLHEIHHTDDRQYRQSLKERVDTVKELSKKLKADL